jgi:branched-chain amino acid transport system ATP-binding protein
VRRSGTAVLRNVTFAVEPGQILRVLGPNGAGKTSLLLAIAGRVPAAEGAILFGGARSPRGAAARARRGLAWTFQAPRPFPEWTVRENVALAAERTGAGDEVERLLVELELTALRDRPAGQLSVGEGKRLELARVLALEPAVLLLDEPLAGLSPEAGERVSGLIERARRQGAAIMWVEHGPAAGELASRLLVLEGGQVRFLGSPADWEAARRAPSAR